MSGKSIDVDIWTGQVTLRSDTRALNERDRVVHLLAPTSWALTLPYVQRSIGLVYTYIYIDATNAGVEAVTLTARATEYIITPAGLVTTIVLDDLYEYALLYSDGNYWHLIALET